MIYIIGPGHGGPALVANAYLEGTYSEVYPNISQDDAGHETAVHAVLLPRRHPQPRRAGNSRLDPRRRRTGLFAVACLRGRVRQSRLDRRLRRRRRRSRNRAAGHRLARQQIPQPRARRLRAADPAPERLQDRQPVLPRPHRRRELRMLCEGYGLQAALRRRTRPGAMHQQMAAVLDKVVAEIKRIWADARAKGGRQARPRWPMIVLRTPEGLDLAAGDRRQEVRRTTGVPIRCRWRDMDKPEHVKILEAMDEELSARRAVRRAGPAQCRNGGAGPARPSRMSDNPHANGGLLLRDLKMPDFRDYAVDVPSPGASRPSPPAIMGKFLRDVMKLNLDSKNFRLFSPDENNSNRWQDVLDVTTRCYMAEIFPTTTSSSRMAGSWKCSANTVPGLAGRLSAHGPARVLSCYEAFIHIIDSMFNQHAKWLKIMQPHSLATADRFAQLLARLARLAAGP